MYYEIRELNSYSMQVSLEDGRLEKPKLSSFTGKSFRVLRNGFWGYYVGDADERMGLKRAEELAVHRGGSEVDPAPFTGKYVYRAKRPLEDVDIEEKVKLLRDIDERLRREGVVSRRVVYVESVRRVRVSNSEGGEVYYEVPRCGVVMQAFAKGKTLQFYSDRVMRVGGFEVVEGIADRAEEVAKIAVELSNASSPPSGEMNVIMNSSLTGVFIHEAFGHAVEGDHVLQNATILKDRVGEVVAAEDVNVYDDPTLEEFGFFPFDDEGYRAEKKTIIENGVLKGFLNSRETAKKLGGRAGNARSDGLEVPIVRMSNTYIAPGDHSLDELLEMAGEGVILYGSRGGETNPATGYFHFNAQYGFRIENGEIGEMVRDVSLSGHTLRILREIRLGREISFDPGFCGKAGQLVPVSDGGPFALVRAFVGGE
ncbi:putative Zn-dependent protease [Geoglobus ahangari]|uniref:Putative Zn-dependent protease n=1 Tax=Geoglobus ahangari TaxID=113653 RepID=A0A0F7IHA9_9EURY|nr:TldD/PmbA family protein [Geoglobus ahangari]AKG92043.1 putative Zn-dependent protease [Geoglobus ahangari]